MQKRLHFLLVLLLFFTTSLMAQVTTSSINGKVVAAGEHVIGATVTAVHTPSGTTYTAVTNTDGRYTIQGMRVGGPYKVTISYIGFKDETRSNLYLTLGEPTVINTDLKEDAKMLGEVTVTGIAGKGGMGAASNFSQKQIDNTPTINRNVYDVAKLSPLVNTSKLGGISIAGSNNRYNSFQIDGMVSNDVFGLASSGTNGGQTGTNPIAMDAIEQIQVVASPFDVRQGGFTGGGINAITKSGTNTFNASAYTYYTDENLYSKWSQVLDKEAKLGKQSTKTYGASLSGAFVKDKVFFFTNIELKKNTYPTSIYPGYIPEYITDADAKLIADTYYRYTKIRDSYGARDIDSRSISALSRLDWNIDNDNKFTFRYQLNSSYKDVYGVNSKTYTFNNSGYRMNNRTNSFVAELNSRLNDVLFNEARIGASFIRDHRGVKYAGPNVTIEGLGHKGGMKAYIGTDFSSGANHLYQDIYTIEDNLNWSLGNHNITFGTHNEFYNMQNLFIQANTGAYYYKTLADFVNDRAWKYTYNYSDVALTGKTDWAGTVEAAQFAFYVQDKWDLNNNLNLTSGLRLDIPTGLNSPTSNPEFNRSAYAIENDVRVGEIPSTKFMWSPRVGFRWYTNDSHNMLLRGGVGLFTGRVPFVWLSNAWNNTGMEMKGTTLRTAGHIPSLQHYGTNAYGAAMSAPPGSASKPTINTISKKFKYPQVLRANLAMETILPGDIKMTLEGLYSKTLNNVWFDNLALKADGTSYAVDATTPASATRHFKTNAGDYYAIINLRNTNKGYSYSASTKLEKSFAWGLDLMASYTFGHSYSVNDGTSSVAYSNWKYNYCVDPTDRNELAKSMFDVPHRVLAVASYTSPKYCNGRFATNVSITYNGNSGQHYSLTMDEKADFNGDSQFGNTLLYIPTEAELAKMKFATEADRKAFGEWINRHDFAKNNRGKYSKRNAATAPWENRFDVHFAQSFFYLKERGSKIELTFDIENFANLLNHNWGTSYELAYNETILKVTKMTASGTNYVPTYTYLGYGPRKSDIFSRWHMQIGLRATF